MKTTISPILLSNQGKNHPFWVGSNIKWQIEFGLINRFYNGLSTYNSINEIQASGAIEFLRASSKNALSLNKNYNNIGTNIPAISDIGLSIEDTCTNYVPNSSSNGAALNTIPYGWNIPTSFGGINGQVIGSGTEYGLPYIDIRASGTPTSSTYGMASWTSGALIPAVQGDTWRSSFMLRKVAGTYNNINTLYSAIRERNNANTLSTTFQNGLLQDEFQTINNEKLFSNASSNCIWHDFNMNLNINSPIDITLRFYCPQLIKNSQIGTPIITNGTAATRAADSFIIKPVKQANNNGSYNIYNVTLTFSDNSTQTFTSQNISSSGWTIPINNNNRYIRKITGI